MGTAGGSAHPLAAAEPAGRSVTRFLPGLRLLTQYDRKWLRPDMLAGLTLWALVVPQGLAYGQLAGLSPVTGLYVGLAGMLAYALLGTSRYLTVGPESSVAMIVAVELAPLAHGDKARYAALAGMLALIVGGMLLLGFVARLGVVTRLLSSPVLTGYLAGSGVVIAVSQLPKVTGIETDKQYPRVLGGLVHSSDTAKPWAIAIGVATGVVVLALTRFARRLPSGLIAMAGATVFVAITGLSSAVAVVGHVESGLPSPGLPHAPLADLPSLLAPGGSIALLIFASSVLTAQALATRDREDVRPNREFLALGGANLFSGLLHGWPANGSDSRSFAVATSGARSQLAGVVAAGLLAITLIALTSLFHDLPTAALGAVVILTALKLVNVRAFRRLARVRTSDFVLALATMLGVLILGVLEGIVVGVLASLVEVLRRAALPHSAVLGRLEGETTTYRDVESYADAETRPGLIVYRFDAPIFFANADVFRDQVLRLVDQAEQPVNEVIVNAEAIYDVDTTGIEMLGRLRDDLEARNVRLTFARVRTTLRALMRRTGLEDRLGADSFSLRVEDAAAAYEARPAPKPA